MFCPLFLEYTLIVRLPDFDVVGFDSRIKPFALMSLVVVAETEAARVVLSHRTAGCGIVYGECSQHFVLTLFNDG